MAHLLAGLCECRIFNDACNGSRSLFSKSAACSGFLTASSAASTPEVLRIGQVTLSEKQNSLHRRSRPDEAPAALLPVYRMTLNQ